MINKKTLLTASGILTGLTIVMGTLEPFRLCGDSWRKCMDLNYNIDLVILPIIPLFLFSLITYKMRDEVYKAWFRFSYVWIPLSMILIFLAPEYPTSGGFLSLYAATKGSVAFVSSTFFVAISLILVVYKHITSRRSI